MHQHNNNNNNHNDNNETRPKCQFYFSNNKKYLSFVRVWKKKLLFLTLFVLLFKSVAKKKKPSNLVDYLQKQKISFENETGGHFLILLVLSSLSKNGDCGQKNKTAKSDRETSASPIKFGVSHILCVFPEANKMTPTAIAYYYFQNVGQLKKLMFKLKKIHRNTAALQPHYYY